MISVKQIICGALTRIVCIVTMAAKRKRETGSMYKIIENIRKQEEAESLGEATEFMFVFCFPPSRPATSSKELFIKQ